MSHDPSAGFVELSLDQATIDDEEAVRHVALYADLKSVLLKASYTFRVLPAGQTGRWDLALLLNLCFWGTDGGGDVLVDGSIAADVLAHAAWHHLAAGALADPSGGRPSAETLYMGEAIASAHDIYLVGRLLGVAPDSSFLETQVPAMAEAAEAAGLSDDDFAEMLQEVAADPERAFEDLRSLLFDTMTALHSCNSAEEGLAVLTTLEARRFGSLLHHYELSTWVLHARAHGGPGTDSRARDLDLMLREASVSLDWLTREWVRPALA